MTQLKISLLALMALLALSGQAMAQALIPSPPAISASSHILIDADSGKVIAEYQADEKLPPASLTKMMTSYILSHELAAGHVSHDDMVTVSKKAWAKNFPGSSLMWIEVGKQVRLEDLHRGVVISSGNDASVAVAEHLAGSESAFAELMNQQAQILGMDDSHFVNPHGLPAEGHYTTARDLATLAKALIVDYPEDYKIYAEKEFTYNNIKQPNRNTLLWRDPSVDGLKTGHTEEAGYGLVASAKKNGMRLISVVMGTSSNRARMQETQKLFSYGFRYFETHEVYGAQQELQKIRVWTGSQDQIAAGVGEAVFLTIPRGQKDKVKAELVVDGTLRAPIEQGQRVGRVVFQLAGSELAEVPLLAMENVEQAGLFSRLWDELILFIMQLFKS